MFDSSSILKPTDKNEHERNLIGKTNLVRDYVLSTGENRHLRIHQSRSVGSFLLESTYGSESNTYTFKAEHFFSQILIL